VSRASILVVEDDLALLKSEAMTLRHFGFDVTEAADGASAVEMFKDRSFDAVVMDGKMPIMDGFEACGQIHRQPRGAGIPILMVTGVSDNKAIESAYEAGATDYILKPVNLTVLSYKLRHLIEHGRLQAALDAARDEQEKLARLDLLGLLAGGIAHDFNNLLTAAFSSLSLAQMETAPDSNTARHLYSLQPVMEQMRRLSQQLLTFSKGGTPVKKICDVGRLLRQTTEFSLRGTNVSPVYEIGEELWPANIDEGQIVQVFSNLIVNATQAMKNGGKLYVSAHNIVAEADPARNLLRGNYLKLDFRDEGEGIPAQILTRIFDPYFTTKKSGSGLGLATVLSIVKKHLGDISVQSEPGRGTLFSILLPAEALQVRVEAAPNNPATRDANLPKENLKVLLLEDQEIVRSAATALLQKCGCTVEAYDDGEKAVEAYLRAERFDLVILDMTLPGSLSGLDTMKALQAFDPEVRAVVSTGYSDDPVMAEPGKYGFCGVLPKPYTFDALRSLVERFSYQEENLTKK